MTGRCPARFGSSTGRSRRRGAGRSALAAGPDFLLDLRDEDDADRGGAGVACRMWQQQPGGPMQRGGGDVVQEAIRVLDDRSGSHPLDAGCERRGVHQDCSGAVRAADSAVREAEGLGRRGCLDVRDGVRGAHLHCTAGGDDAFELFEYLSVTF